MENKQTKKALQYIFLATKDFLNILSQQVRVSVGEQCHNCPAPGKALELAAH